MPKCLAASHPSAWIWASLGCLGGRAETSRHWASNRGSSDAQYWDRVESHGAPPIEDRNWMREARSPSGSDVQPQKSTYIRGSVWTGPPWSTSWPGSGQAGIRGPGRGGPTPGKTGPSPPSGQPAVGETAPWTTAGSTAPVAVTPVHAPDGAADRSRAATTEAPATEAGATRRLDRNMRIHRLATGTSSACIFHPSGRRCTSWGYPAAPNAVLICWMASVSGGLTLLPPSLWAAATLSATDSTNRR